MLDSFLVDHFLAGDNWVVGCFARFINNEMFVALVKQLRENAEIKVFTDLL